MARRARAGQLHCPGSRKGTPRRQVECAHDPRQQADLPHRPGSPEPGLGRAHPRCHPLRPDLPDPGQGILPKINRTLAEREDAIDGGTDRADGLRAEATAVREQYEAELAEARHDAARIRSQATEEGSKAIAAARAEGIAERDGILAAGHQQIAAERETAERELAGDVDSWAHALAGRIVGEPVGAQRA
ncbi:ATP synthase B chain [Streptomyces laurentii]|uniref:ATP synthase B chain n=1 Tax=Streptomyces laurentii TaxID=39478 RepID=A0A160P7Z1_STRLU|nr:ATP synthase B chain [Streptomyces laurentii]